MIFTNAVTASEIKIDIDVFEVLVFKAWGNRKFKKYVLFQDLERNAI